MKRILPRVLSVLCIVAVISLALWGLFEVGLLSLSKEGLQEKLEAYGALAPLLFILLTVLQSSLLPIPSTVTILAGAYLFGAVESFFYTYGGLLVGGILAFFLGRFAGRPFVNWLAGEGRVDALVARARGREHVVIFFMFLFPLVPDYVLCLAAGLLPISLRSFLLMQMPTRALTVGITLLVFSGEVIPFEGWGIVVMAAVTLFAVAMFIVALIYTERLNAVLMRIANALGRRFAKKGEGVDKGENA